MDSETPDLEKILEEVKRQLGLNDEDMNIFNDSLDLHLPEELKSMNEAIELVKSAYFQEIAAQLNNYLTPAKTLAEKINNKEIVPERFVELTIQNLQNAVELLKRYKETKQS